MGAKRLGFKLRQKKVARKAVAKAHVVDIDSYKCKKQTRPKHWVKGLTTTDQAVLLNGDWLNDDIP